MKLFNNKFIIFFCAALLLVISQFYSCKDDAIVPGNSQSYTSYFPLIHGHWVEYNADSIVHLDIDDAYNLDTAIRTYHFQLREEIDSSYTDAGGEIAWRVSRYRRADSNSPWTFMNLWTAKRSNNSAQRVEDNIRFIKLAFPFDPRISWNGNAYNNYPLEEYSYDAINEEYTVNSSIFDSTVSVIQNNFVSNINRIDKREIYAQNVGMIYKVLDSLNIVNLPNGSTVILNGTEYKLEIRDYKR
ncbi:MAG: hypothetical protein EYC69_07985 [Bacteroidetes bacterium]|nr:MAG: hypothetical protein EYC69_07985 [Bacteroidota bacterium]